MPTPVSVARQCLTAEAVQALDEAVGVARKRGHTQTTSLHAVSALLSLPSLPILRDACARARNSAYSSRLQFKALELCLGVSLDRIQSGQPASGGSDGPPVSNSLMAAIKRSQAHQRRLPENFRLNHEISQQQQNQNSASCFKVELRQLVLSILDDPVVSRVFGEAGFRSSEIKLSIVRPISHVLRNPRPRVPPLFLCNVTENPNPGIGSGLYSGRRGFNYPFPGFTGFFHEDGNNRRIGEVLARAKGRNPLLMGVSAYGALTEFVHSLDRRKDGILPKEINGLNVINIGNEIPDKISKSFDKTYASTSTRFEELAKLVEQSSGPGLVVNYGDLSVFTNTDDGGNSGLSGGSASYVVARFSELLQRYGNRVWLIGAAASDEVYFKFVRRFPSVEKDWDLQALTITSLGPCLVEKPYPKSSLMESFVPFGGFFSTPPELKAPFTSTCKLAAYYNVQDQNHQKELAGLPKGGLMSSVSVSDLYQSSLPSWLQMTTEADITKGLGSRTEEGVCLLRGKNPYILPIQNEEILEPNTCQVGNKFPRILGFQVTNSHSSGDENRNSLSEPEGLDSGGGLKSPSSFSGSITGSANSVTTDLGLGIGSVSTNTEVEIQMNQKPVDEITRTGNFAQSQSSFSSCPENQGQFDPDNLKILFRTLTERVKQQDEAARVISHAIAQWRTSNRRGDIWFNFTGPDTISKKKIAILLSEMMYQSTENLITLDLGSQEMYGHDLLSFRGKTVVDYIYSKLCRNPLCVIFLENLNKADEQLQTSLSLAVQTGKFSDSHGREVSICNTVFVTTLLSENSLMKPSFYYSEEKIIRAKGRNMEISIEHAFSLPFATSISSPSSLNKRKLIGKDKTMEKNCRKPTRVLDLNLPAQETELQDKYARSEDQFHENSSAWLQNFMNQIRVVNVLFKPFDFDGLAERITKGINGTFHKLVNSDSCLEIDPRVIEQLLAAEYFSDRSRVVGDWVERVLSHGFAEAQKMYNVNSGSVFKLLARDAGSISDVETQENQNPLLPNKVFVS